MDDNSFSSELIESLDYLRPPVQRTTKLPGSVSTVGVGGVKVQKHFRTKVTKKTQFPKTKRRSIETTSSLVFKNTVQKEVSDDPVLSYSNLFGTKEYERKLLTKQILDGVEKPVIRVIVTPKAATAHTQTSAILRKGKHNVKKVQTTVSDHEITSIKAKNLFLVARGREKEKVNKFKRTGSAKLISTDTQKCKDDYVSLDQISSIKLVLDSLNMNRNNDVAKKGASTRFCISPNCPKESQLYKNRECSCSNTARGDVDAKKSWVRIIGCVGLTEDDRYVLNCNTTIDDKQVDSVRFYSAPRDDRRHSHSCDVGTCPALEGLSKNFRCQKYFKEQEDLSNFFCKKSETKSTNPRFNVCSCCDRLNCDYKATQVRSSICTKDCNIQVDFPNDKQNCEAASDAYGTSSRYQRSQASHGTQVNFNVGFTVPQCYTCNCPVKNQIIQCCCSNKENGDESSSENVSDAKYLKKCQSPMVVISVYPMQSNSDNVEVSTDPPFRQNTTIFSAQKNTQMKNKTKEVNTTKISNRGKRAASKSPAKSRSRSPSPPTKTQSKTNVKESKVLKTDNIRSGKSSPTRERKLSPYKTNRQTKINTENPITNFERNKTFGRSNLWSKKVNTSTNTEHNITKKLLVDNYTKHLTALMQRDTDEKDCDCDGNNKCFDIRLMQGLKDNKTLSYKDRISSVQKSAQIVPEKYPKHRTVSPTSHKDDQKREAFRRLQVRDSLEIFHRRESSLQNTNEKGKNKAPPTKHYRGDSCPISDPLQRDQEIRALLGVNNAKHMATSMTHSVSNIVCQCWCCADGKCCRKFKYFKLLRKNLTNSCVCTDIMKKYNSKSGTGMSGASNNINERTSYNSIRNDIAQSLRIGDDKIEIPKNIVDTNNNNYPSNETTSYDRNNNGKIVTGRARNRTIISDKKATNTSNESNIRTVDSRTRHSRVTNDKFGNGSIGYGRTSEHRITFDGINISKAGFNQFRNDRVGSNRNGYGRRSNHTNDNASIEYSKISKSLSLPRTKCECQSSEDSDLVICKCPRQYTSDHNSRASDTYSKAIANTTSASIGKVHCACPNPTPTIDKLDPTDIKSLAPKRSVTPVTKSTQYEDEPLGIESVKPRSQKTSLCGQLILNRNIQIFLQVEQFCKQKPIVLSRKQYDKVRKTIENTLTKSKRRSFICKSSLISVGEVRRKSKHSKSLVTLKEVETQQQSGEEPEINPSSSEEVEEQKAYFVFTGQHTSNVKNESTRLTRQQEPSTMELQRTSISRTKYITFSSTNVEVGSLASPLDEKESLSLHTIFKGHRRCATPNLGTSICSLNSEEDECLQPAKRLPVSKAKSKKPFLKRLMSCLVMRSTVTEMNPRVTASPALSNKTSIASTFDAYHISSAFCGVEMSSSMYDTSISFYTNHSVYPINSKINKRGFFNSVREFLSIRKSQSIKNP